MATFRTVLPRLAAAYEIGRLVPFIGSGMSVPVCTDWGTFVHRLESEAAGKPLPRYRKNIAREDLIRRANNAVRQLRAGKAGVFPAAVRRALLSGVSTIPSQTVALAALRWPLVVSTNYDNCYAAAVAKLRPPRPLAVVGRSDEDCQRVLSSLSVAGRSLLWSIQGYLDTPYRIPEPSGADAAARQAHDAALQSELVVGHEEYRRVTYGALHFRRAFAEVFRQRSLLFLGAGIQEPYLQDLFGEILEYYGPSTRPHYAFLKKGQVDPGFMLARFQIITVEYDDHGEVIRRLEQLAAVAKRPRRAPVSWSWGRIAATPDEPRNWKSLPDLDVVRGPLPEGHLDGACLAISAGGSKHDFYFSRGIRRLMRTWHADPNEQPRFLSHYVGEYPGRDVFAVRARRVGDDRSLAHIHHASLDLFNRVGQRYRRIHMQLLATGGKEKHGVPDHVWKVRTYPERFSFVQIVRAWGAWREQNKHVDCRLTLHVVLEEVYQDVASGRIDVLEQLTSRDLRFFVEIMTDDGRLERRLCQMMPDVRIRDLVRQLQLSPRYWTMTVTPPASIELRENEPVQSRLAETLQALGVVPGSTIHFHRIDPRATGRRRSTSRSRRRRSSPASRSRR